MVKIMKINYKIFGLVMFVMLVCCVSVASAADVDNITVPDDADIIVTDDIADSVDVVEDDGSSDDIIDEVVDSQIDDTIDDGVTDEKINVTRGSQDQVTSNSVSKYFDSNGYIRSSAPTGLQFSGNFNNVGFSNFIINKNVALSFANANFNNVGFKLLYPGLSIYGATFTMTTSAPNEAAIYAGANGIIINNVNINVNAPSNKNCYAINVLNANNTQITNSVITYQCGYANANKYNYAIKVKNSANVKVASNNITATLPLKTVVYSNTGLERDYVAGVGVGDSNYFNFTKNKLDVTGNLRSGSYPTLDALIIWQSHNSYVGQNIITEKDIITASNQYSYIYGVDVYRSNNVNVHNNTITMNADQSGGYVGGNGTGAAYCVQCTGPYTGVTVSNNRLTTQNNGPNAAIYSQNWDGPTNITVSGNTISVTGKGTDSNWDVLTGMELQDTYATVTGNTITVTNKVDYYDDYNVYGISYCQYTPYGHTYIITGNTVDVINGRYTVCLLNGSTHSISNNTLHSNDGLFDYYDDDTICTNG